MNGDTPLGMRADVLVTDLDPLIVTAPVIRSGTTLLQRLLCSSRRALIFGEKCADDLDLFLNLYAFKVREYGYHKQRYAQGLQRVLAGDVNDWIPDLMPDVEGYLAALGRSAFAGVTYCRSYALRAGRPVWGFKYPGWKPPTVRLLRTVMPQARFIFLYRDIIDCLRSAKAQDAVSSLPEVRDFCQTWAEGLRDALDLAGDPALLVLRYEELLADPAAALARIGCFSGLADMDPAVLEHKINTWRGEDYLAQQRDGYTPPSELTAGELQIVDRLTSGLRARLYTALPALTGLEQPERMY
jgi:hypothetical protein